MDLKVPNNKYSTCPALMSDGRLFTDYRPRCNSMEAMLTKGMSSYDYRQYLIQHADELMQEHRHQAIAVGACESCDASDKCMMTEETATLCSASTCTTQVNDVNGLGRGRTYDTGRVMISEDVNALPYKPMQPERGHYQSSRLGAAGEDALGNFYPITGAFIR